MSTIIKASPIARSVYGYTSASLDSWCHYGYALLIIAGADGIVSDEEMEWLINIHEKMLEAPGEVIEALTTFDYREARLEDVLPQIRFDVPVDYRRTLIYDAIKMSFADADFAVKEKRAVRRAAELLDVNLETAESIEEIINIERAVDLMRTQVLHIKKAKDLFGDTIEGEIVDSISLFIRRNYDGLSIEAADSLSDYGKALLTISGADGDVSKDEMSWLRNYFIMIHEEAEEALEQIDDFNYVEAKLEDVLKKLDNDSTFGFVRSSLRRTLLYHAIQMAAADNDYDPAEKLMVRKAAKLLKVDVNTARLIEGLVKTEEGIERMRRSIFEIGDDVIEDSNL